jgi:hypothetical protein
LTLVSDEKAARAHFGPVRQESEIVSHLSGDGNWLTFVQDRKIFQWDTDTKAVRAVAVLPENLVPKETYYDGRGRIFVASDVETPTRVRQRLSIVERSGRVTHLELASGFWVDAILPLGSNRVAVMHWGAKEFSLVEFRGGRHTVRAVSVPGTTGASTVVDGRLLLSTEEGPIYRFDGQSLGPIEGLSERGGWVVAAGNNGTILVAFNRTALFSSSTRCLLHSLRTHKKVREQTLGSMVVDGSYLAGKGYYFIAQEDGDLWAIPDNDKLPMTRLGKIPGPWLSHRQARVFGEHLWVEGKLYRVALSKAE